MNTSYSFIDYSTFYYQKNRICGIFVNVFLLSSDLKSMVNSSAFQGTHREFLLSQKARYVAGVVLELDYVICHMVSRLTDLVISWSQD